MAVTMVGRTSAGYPETRSAFIYGDFLRDYVLVEGAKGSSCTTLGGPGSPISNAGVLQYDNRRTSISCIIDDLVNTQLER